MTVLPRWVSSYLALSGSAYARIDCDGCIHPLPDLGGSTRYTVTAWVRLDSLPPAGTEWPIVSRWDPANLAQSQFKLAVDSDGNLRSYRNSTDNGVAAGTVPLTLHAWNSVATTYDGEELVVYVNGTPSAPVADTSPVPSSGMEVDIGAESGQNFFQGGVARMQLWAGLALGEEEVVLESMQWTAQDDIGNYPYLAASFDFTRLPLIDQSGSVLTLAPIGGASPIVSAPVLDLTAQGAAVNCGGFPALDEYTVDGWIFLPGIPPAGGQIIGQTIVEQSDTNPQWWLACTSEGELQSFRNAGIGSQVRTGALTPQVWYHFATTYDGEALRIFVNGNLQAAAAMSGRMGLSDQPVMIGASGTTTPTFGGYLQNLRIWSVALGEASIRQWMYDDPVNDPAMLAGFDVTSMKLLDNTGRSSVVLQNGAIVSTPQRVLDPGDMVSGWLQPSVAVS
ncbi:MAG TPA: LamG domain-containing protein, partial [Acidimicrobiales bacterium]|nr:LamG domain-containing protein [Acidimicrobiales bacterium]